MVMLRLLRIVGSLVDFVYMWRLGLDMCLMLVMDCLWFGLYFSVSVRFFLMWVLVVF